MSAPQDFTIFCILATARTGSTLLCRMLDSHPNLTCHGEAYHPDAVFTEFTKHFMFIAQGWPDVPFPTELNQTRYRDANPVGFLRELADLTHRVRPNQSRMGFKLFPGHNRAMHDYVMQQGSVLKILLRRDNVLHQYSSHKIATQVGRWVANHPSQLQPGKARFDQQEFLHYVQQVEAEYAAFQDHLAHHGQRAFKITYEELLDKVRMSELLDFLGVRSDVPLIPPILKQNASETAARFENYDDVAAALSGTPMERWLE